ncbi:hypothetical protein ES703_82911 [subsurface metagenome]
MGLYPKLYQVVGKLFRHPLGQGSHQAAFAFVHPLFNLVEQVVNLTLSRLDFNSRLEQPGRTDKLLHHLLVMLFFVGSRCCRGVDSLFDPRLELVKTERAIIQRRRQAEAVVHQGLLAGAVTVEHAIKLGDGHVRFVDDQQEIIREVVQQRPG